MWNLLSLLTLGQKGGKIKSPKVKIFVGVWTSPYTHPCPQQLFSSCEIEAEASSSSLALEHHPLCFYYPDFSGQRPLLLCCSLETLLLSALAWQLHWIWAHRVIYWVCWYSVAWFRREKRERERSMECTKKAIYALLLLIIIKINVSPMWLLWPLSLHLTF